RGDELRRRHLRRRALSRRRGRDGRGRGRDARAHTARLRGAPRALRNRAAGALDPRAVPLRGERNDAGGPLMAKTLPHGLPFAPVKAGVAAVTWTGTDRYHGEYCFNLGNGGLAEEAAMMAAWIRRQGHRTVGMIHELSPGGVEYASNFRYYAARAA